MGRRVTLLILIVSLVLGGCCYAPGNEKTSLMEMWMKLPTLPMEDYQSNKQYPTDETVDPSAPTEPEVIEAPGITFLTSLWS